PLRLLSFATPEDAAAERRRRKRCLRKEPPSNSLGQPQRRPLTPIKNPNPNSPNLKLILMAALFDNPNIDSILKLELFRKNTDTALKHYRQLIDNAPFSVSPTTYRILVKGLVDNSKIEQALPQKDDMIEKGLLKNGDSDGALSLFEELRRTLGGLKQWDCYNEAVGEISSIRMNAVAYSPILDE
ncbi:hypothetical protein C5167_046497, partial [Papaver somniferum]